MKGTGALKKLMMSLVVVGAVTGVIGAGTFATFTASTSMAGNTFATGTVDIATDPAETVFNVDNMAPGDVVYDTLDVTNSGSLELSYVMSTTATNDDNKGLAAQLNLQVQEKGEADCDKNFVFNDALHNSSLGSASLGGDRVLAASGAETFCFRVEFPKGAQGADNLFQDATTTVTFTFDAEQTANMN